MRRRPAGFARLQNLESRLVAAAFADLHPPWLLEVAPLASASPLIEYRYTRLLVDGELCRWPFEAALGSWPIDDDSVPALLLRHLWQPAIDADLLGEAVRVLRPGGLLVSVSANPWHRQAWRELGGSALRLPSWPQFQWMHARCGLQLAVTAIVQLRSLIPGLMPVLVLVARKPSEPVRIEALRFSRPQMNDGSAAVPSQYRAA